MSRVGVTGRSSGLGAGVGLVGICVTVGVLVPFRSDVSRATPALLLVAAVVAAGLVGGTWPAMTTAVAAAAVFNLAFVPPYWTLKVNATEDWIALGVLLAVGLTVGLLVANETERRRGAEQREAEIRSLYQRIESIALDRSRLAEEAARVEVLQRVDEQRSALLRSVSHDLRSPLAAIRAAAGELRDGTVYDETTRTELLSTVCDEADRLDRIVSNLLSLSRIEAGAFTPDRQAIPLDELVEERLRHMRPLFGHVRLQVALPEGALVDGDYTQLDLVVTNLLENAARHAPPESTVRIEGRRRGDDIEVSICDEGTGVPEWERTRIFEPFRRAEGSSSSGIGLAICKAIVEAHGGRIWVDRTPGGGATFTFDLPVREMGR